MSSYALHLFISLTLTLTLSRSRSRSLTLTLTLTLTLAIALALALARTQGTRTYRASAYSENAYMRLPQHHASENIGVSEHLLLAFLPRGAVRCNTNTSIMKQRCQTWRL